MALGLALAAPARAGRGLPLAGRVAAGQTVEIEGVNGGITAEARGGEAEVTAVKRGRKSDPAASRSRSWSTAAASPSAPSTRRGPAPNKCVPGGAAA